MSFLITGLPRSRTAWFAEFMQCDHEPIVNMNEPHEILEYFSENEGCSDFGMGFFLGSIIQTVAPRILIIDRDIDDVEKSLENLNLDLPKTNFCKVLLANLDLFKDDQSVMVVKFEDINERIHEIYAYLKPGQKFPQDRFGQLKNKVIEADCSKVHFTGTIMKKYISPLLTVETKNFKQITSGVKVDDLLAKITDDLWDRNPARLSNFGPHRESHDIYIRGEDETPYFNGEIPWSKHGAPYIPVWFQSVDVLPEAKILALELMGRLGAEMLGLVIIYKIAPGEKIYPHIDKGWHPEFYDKFNICLQSNDKAAFVYEDERLIQKAGDIHFFRNNVEHSVINEGDTDHIVMIVSLRFDRGYRCPYAPEGWSLDLPEDLCQQVG